MSWKSIRGFAAVIAVCLTAEAADVGKWIEQLGANDREQRREAGYQLTLLGAQARPALPALIKALDDPDRQVWAYAVAAIANLGPEASEAVPKLMEGLDSGKSRGFRPRDKAQILFRNAYALTKIGDAAKPELLAALKAEDMSLRVGATKALGGMGVKATEAIPAFIENLSQDHADLRAETTEALASVGKPSVAPLIEALANPNPKTRAGSAFALALLGPEAAPAGTVLLERVAKEEDVATRASMLAALPRVGLPHEKVVPELIAALADPKEDLNRAAIDAFLLVRPAGKVAVPALMKMMEEGKGAERAASVLGRFGSESRAAVSALLPHAAKDPDGPFGQALVSIGAAAVPGVLAEVAKRPAVAAEASELRILAAIGPAGLPELQKALASPTSQVRVAALITLEKLGLDAREARPAVAKLSTDADSRVRAQALRAMVSLGLKPPQAFEPIEAGLADREPGVRLAAADAAGNLGAQARPLAGKVAGLLADGNQPVRIAAVRALGLIGGSGEWTDQLVALLNEPKLQLVTVEALAQLKVSSVTPRLIDLFPKAERPVRLAILNALGGSGEAARPILESAVQDEDRELRAAAIAALARNQPNLETFLPVLVTAFGDSNTALRHAAAASAVVLAERQADKLVVLVEPLVKMAEKAENAEDRGVALETLRALRVRNADALAIGLNSPNVEARIWAIERIGRLGNDARPLRPQLEALARDSNDYIRRASRRALQQLGR